jgi:exosortase A-associated hydrolase 2
LSQSAAPAQRAFHLGTGGAQRVCVLHLPAAGPLAGAIVHVHPFAEEMNKSRRMAALQSRLFAAAGYAVLRIDLAGCGDSPGDFSQATWATWIDDVRRAALWLNAEVGHRPWLWGQRAGCLLCVQALPDQAPDAARLLFWQPAAVGKTLLQQFRRLRTAGELLKKQPLGAGSEPGPSRGGPGLAGEPEVVAGYELNAELTRGLEAAVLRPPAAHTVSVWLEVSSRAAAELLPATRRCIDEWRAQGHEVTAETVQGPPFWQTQDIEVAPALLQASLRCVQAADRARADA